ncbi:lipopolysaccharide kinase [Microbispora sp. GKU 823]|nr:lipopolysaccharide kinase [Microbispora sp. GKU 823]
MQITGAPSDPDLIRLPWDVPLEEWPVHHLVTLPRGISRHVVRFARLSGRVYAIKEISTRYAKREYQLLWDLARHDAPAVEPVAIVTGRTAPDGSELDSALITRHLQFSLPYRAVLSGSVRPDTLIRLLDALAVLLVRLHLTGFYWGDCSLSNTLFRRDAGAFAAYLVDAETGELHPAISEGQRAHDIDVAHVNIYGEMLDLEAGGLLHPTIDPLAFAEQLVERYHRLWDELTEDEIIEEVDWHRVDQRVRRLNSLGFDVAEMMVRRKAGTSRLIVRPKVVDAGHHQRRLLRLTGLDVEENQARRLLNDLDSFRVSTGLRHEDEAIVAHRWLAEVFQPVVNAIPADLRRKLEPAQLFHEVLDHRWYMSEAAGKDVGLEAAVRSYVDNVLVHKPDENAVIVTSDPLSP